MEVEPMTDPREPGAAPGEASEPDLPVRGIGAALDEPASVAPVLEGPSATSSVELTPAPIPSASQLGPVPAVAGSDRMRALLRARLFGGDASAPSDDDDHDERDHASRSGIIGGLDTDPGEGVRRR